MSYEKRLELMRVAKKPCESCGEKIIEAVTEGGAILKLNPNRRAFRVVYGFHPVKKNWGPVRAVFNRYVKTEHNCGERHIPRQNDAR